MPFLVIGQLADQQFYQLDSLEIRFIQQSPRPRDSRLIDHPVTRADDTYGKLLMPILIFARRVTADRQPPHPSTTFDVGALTTSPPPTTRRPTG
jgi:hypothetical protein